MSARRLTVATHLYPSLCGKAKGNTNFLTLWLLLKEQLQGHNGRAHAGHGLRVVGECVNIDKK